MQARQASAGTAPRTDRDTVRVGGLEVDRAPVTNERYARFVAATGHRPPLFWPRGEPPAALARHPVVGIDFYDAVAFALWAGGSLPTELEWVEASGLPAHRAYVWGDAFDRARCNTVRSGRKGTSPVGAYPAGTAPSGCVDLCGNVWELTCSADRATPGAVLVKGGSWYDFPCHAKIDASFNARVDRASSTVGFRLVYGKGLRLPAFLEREETARAVARRRAVPRTPRAAGDDAEPGRVLADLRARAADTVGELPAALPGFDAGPIEQALRVFDEARDPPAGRVSRSVPDLTPRKLRTVPGARYVPRVARWFADGIERNPRVAHWLLFAASAAVVALLWNTARAAESAARGRPEELRRVAPPPAPGPRAVPAAREAAPDRLGAFERALRDLREGPARERAAAQDFLIRHPEAAAGRVRRALAAARDEAARAACRYVLAAIEEVRGRAERPLILRRRPTQGLVLCADELDAPTLRLVTEIRRTARAERVPFTLVLHTDRAPEEVVDLHALELGAISLFTDPERGLARTLAGDAGRGPLVAGLRADGAPAFLHRGVLGRAVLAARVPLLR